MFRTLLLVLLLCASFGSVAGQNGKLLTMQGIDSHGLVLSAVLPLADFAKAYDGPGQDSQEYMRKLREQYPVKRVPSPL